VRLQDNVTALELLQPYLRRWRSDCFNHAKADPDLDPIRGHPRFKRLFESADRGSRRKGRHSLR